MASNVGIAGANYMMVERESTPHPPPPPPPSTPHQRGGSVVVGEEEGEGEGVTAPTAETNSHCAQVSTQCHGLYMTLYMYYGRNIAAFVFDLSPKTVDSS